VPPVRGSVPCGLSGDCAANRSVQANPRFSPPYWMRAAALANLGRVEEAKIVAQRLLEVQPLFTITSVTSAPFANPQILAALGNALRCVGLPEMNPGRHLAPR
jgi:hypothetical protein